MNSQRESLIQPLVYNYPNTANKTEPGTERAELATPQLGEFILAEPLPRPETRYSYSVFFLPLSGLALFLAARGCPLPRLALCLKELLSLLTKCLFSVRQPYLYQPAQLSVLSLSARLLFFYIFFSISVTVNLTLGLAARWFIPVAIQSIKGPWQGLGSIIFLLGLFFSTQSIEQLPALLACTLLGVYQLAFNQSQSIISFAVGFAITAAIFIGLPWEVQDPWQLLIPTVLLGVHAGIQLYVEPLTLGLCQSQKSFVKRLDWVLGSLLTLGFGWPCLAGLGVTVSSLAAVQQL